jgi:iron complex outermembrane receptor protein
MCARPAAFATLALVCAGASAKEDAVVVSATRVEHPSLEVPAAIDRLYPEDIREGKAQVNLSESLARVPGITVQNRQNYAQDLQISSRGFGARATFGVRGIRLIADGIPATMPDGQGQAATFALGSASRIEVLRGPFSSLYGNAAGGVITVLTEDGPERPTLDASFSAGSYDAWRAGLKFGTQAGRLNLLVDASRFDAEGYRAHSAVTRDHVNAKLRFEAAPGNTLTLVANNLRQPDTQDPLGLTRAQFEADPRQAVAAAFTFNTRKTVRQDQLGATYNHALGEGARLQATLYGGERFVEQFLAFSGAAPVTSSGGVVQLDRGYGGAALRWFGAPGVLRLAAGMEYERMAERRKGFVNASGVAGALRRDEDDVVDSTDFFAQAEWRFAQAWSAHGGLRTSRVRFRSSDYFIVPGNPDDSGRVSYSASTPVAGLVWRVAPRTSLYANYGRGFETPTFAELAHRNVGSGLNFALQPARSRHLEAGAKTIVPGLARASLALFDVEVRNEIVVDTAAGGRTTFKNAGGTERRGLELSAETLLAGPFDAALAWTVLEAKFRDAFSAGATAVPAGNSLPGVPRAQLYGHLRYRQGGFFAQAELQRRARVPVSDANSEFAPAYSVVNLVAGLTQQGEGWRVQEFVRLDNVNNRNYAGSVIVNEANGRFYEPSPRRNIMIGVQATLQI